jgi:hypothetical protein
MRTRPMFLSKNLQYFQHLNCVCHWWAKYNLYLEAVSFESCPMPFTSADFLQNIQWPRASTGFLPHGGNQFPGEGGGGFSQKITLKSNFKPFKTVFKSRNSVVGIATGYGLDDRRVGVRVPIGSRNFSFPCRSDRLWGSPSLLSNGYRGLFPRG